MGSVRRRRPMLALLIVGAVMTMAPARAVPFAEKPASGDASAHAASSDDAGLLGPAVATVALHEGNSLADDLTGEHLLRDLPAGNSGSNADGGNSSGPLPDIPSGGGSPDGSPAGVRTGDLLGGGNPGGGTPGANPGADPGSSGPRIHFGGLHIGRNGPLLPALPVLPASPAVPALPGVPALSRLPALPAIPAAGNPPALPGTSSGNPSGPGPDALPASLDRAIPGRAVSDPSMTADGAEGETPAATSPTGIHATPSASTTLPRTGAGELFQGPVALALLGASAAARAAARRRC